jgi:hypothetical protein
MRSLFVTASLVPLVGFAVALACCSSSTSPPADATGTIPGVGVVTFGVTPCHGDIPDGACNAYVALSTGTGYAFCDDGVWDYASDIPSGCGVFAPGCDSGTDTGSTNDTGPGSDTSIEADTGADDAETSSGTEAGSTDSGAAPDAG